MSVTVLVGAQFGSEGKGNLARHLAARYNHHVRVGGPNAGHSIQVNGATYKMQQVPCGWANKTAWLYLGAGAVVSAEIVERELQWVREAGHRPERRFLIDARATVLGPQHAEEEGGTGGAMHRAFGSTGEGVGAARISRLRRDPLGQCLVAGHPMLSAFAADTVALLNTAHDKGERVLIEGTQGCGLSIVHGDWPYVTTADVNASGLLADVGFSPRVNPEVILVARTFPIRVAGNSGPLEDELTWGDMQVFHGVHQVEKTTVTKKVRRIGTWNAARFKHAVLLNRPSAICLNFVDYVSPADTGQTSFEKLSPVSRAFIDMVEEIANAPVVWIGTGGPGWTIIDRRWRA